MNPESVGIHALVWSAPGARRTRAGRWAEHAACGYDRVEVPLLDSWAIDLAVTRPLLAEHGPAITGNLFLTGETASLSIPSCTQSNRSPS